jgi:O-6-methylguanine DNA methyltransferase
MKQTSEVILKLPIQTEFGVFCAGYSEAGLAALDFPDAAAAYETPELSARVPKSITAWHELTGEALNSILAGQAPKRFPPFDLSAGTDFQQRVWKALQQIAFGQTRTYAEIAASINNPRAVRAVGGACGANPIPVLIPCHRVLASHNKIGGFSGGLNWKRILLECEGRRTWGALRDA